MKEKEMVSEGNATSLDDSCEYLHIHPELAENVKRGMPTEREQLRLSELFRMFGDATRIKILSALLISELCVCDLAAVVGMSVSAVSHQLRLLKSAELVRSRREGKSAIYSLADDHVRVMISNGMEHILE